jgi:peptidoglycan/LPS O-acetylase OafA/YrhL
MATQRRDRSIAGVRPEIQALRAIAVVSVVVYHLWPRALPGGFVGVDVFFAISGFLIIGHLLREVDRSGRIALASFWARRARRLLPASLLVIVVTAVATILFVPDVVWRQWFQEMGASATYVQNWLLAFNAVDYLGADNKPSPTQHFWSLSVEEQFYIFWPIIIVVALAILRLTSARPRRVVGVLLAVVTVASFAYAVWAVAHTPAAAYFVTQSRAWEFGLGGILAYFAGAPTARWGRIRSVVGWAAIAMLAVTLIFYKPSLPFPGLAALPPVVAALAVIWAGTPPARWSFSAILKLRPIQWLGDTSYSLYLWHWGPIVIIPFMIGSPLDLRWRLIILGGAVAAAALSKRFVEDPIRTSRILTTRPSWASVLGAVVATGLVLAGCISVTSITDQRFAVAAAADARIVANSPCVGAVALAPGATCAQPFAVTALTNPGVAKTDIGKGVREVDDCKQYIAAAAVKKCAIGDVTSPTTKLALVGDSHAGMYLEPLDIYGKAHHIEFVTYLKTWCAGTGAQGVFVQGGDAAIVKSCSDWGLAVLREVVADTTITGVVFSNFTMPYATATPGLSGRPITSSDFASAFDRVRAAGKDVVVIRDIPNDGAVFVPDCVAQHLTEYDPCAMDEKSALLPIAKDPQLAAAKTVKGVHVVDDTDVLCTANKCHAVIGGLITYFDMDHLAATFARTLATVLGARIATAIGLPG